ncbi:MAG TPA: hypothetical protein VHW05_07605 [Phenylobacterium sp.]|nr:hypothetical protein [Phenylobacterium sp.]
MLVWVWSALPISVGLFFGCAGTPLESACEAFGNTDISLPWGLPGTMILLAPREAPLAVELLFPLAFTVLCHWAIRRFLPARIPAWQCALLLVVWSLLGLVTLIGFLFVPIYKWSAIRSLWSR